MTELELVTLFIAFALLVIAVVCAVGWKIAHSTLISLVDVSVDDWADVRNVLRDHLNVHKP